MSSDDLIDCDVLHGLRFRLGEPAARWAHLLDAVVAWDPALRPTQVERLSELEVDELRPWSDALAGELAARLADGPRLAWLLTAGDRRRSLQVRRLVDEVQLVVIEPIAPSPAARFASLVDAIAGSDAPAVALGFGHDAERETDAVLDGLAATATLPPLLYLDGKATAHLGGLARLQAAPCDVRTVAGGVLLVVRETLCADPDDDEQARYEAVRAFLGMGPLRFS
jgi:hypothetical protein